VTGKRRFFLARIAIVQEDSHLGDTSRNLERACGIIQHAAERGAHLVLFPEMFLTGYAIKEDAGRLAEEISGVSIGRLKQVAQRYRIEVCMGFPELEPASGKIYNSLACLSDQGLVRCVYRKIHLYDQEKRYFHPGSEITLADTAIGRAGFLICYDLEFPEPARVLALQGAHILLVATANMKPWCGHQDTYAKSRAMENQVFLAIANRIGTENEMVFCGGSACVDPMGKILCNADGQTPAVLLADIDIGALASARYSSIDYLRDRRPEVYTGLSRESPLRKG
jgi:predicted amidohydrolase